LHVVLCCHCTDDDGTHALIRDADEEREYKAARARLSQQGMDYRNASQVTAAAAAAAKTESAGDMSWRAHFSLRKQSAL
jgi:hypothetical protein